MLLPGTKAPLFTAQDHMGDPISLADFQGRWVLLWWYPKALTPGCTSCGQAFQQRMMAFRAERCVILGASFDTPEVNYEFAKENNFVYPLLSGDRALGKRYEVNRPEDSDWHALPLRISYLIDPDGVIVKSYKVNDVTKHADQVLLDLTHFKALRTPPQTSRPGLLSRVRSLIST